MGMNHMIAGAKRPESLATRPGEAASEQAGAVEATPMTTLEKRPMALGRRPFEVGSTVGVCSAFSGTLVGAGGRRVGGHLGPGNEPLPEVYPSRATAKERVVGR